jgi:hypothetical protein
MRRGRHTQRRFPPAALVVFCFIAASCLAGAQATPLASDHSSVRQTRAKGSFVPIPAAPAATPLSEPSGLAGEPSEPFWATPSPAASVVADPEAYRGLTAIGDSIMVDATPNLRTRFPGLTIDAVAGRQVAVGLQAMQALARAGRLGNIVVVALGTNGSFSATQLGRIAALAAGRRFVMLTNYCPYCSWVPANNELIRTACPQIPNCTVAEWETLAGANPGWFYADGVHMPIGGTGGQAYADLIAQVLEQPGPTHLRQPS